MRRHGLLNLLLILATSTLLTISCASKSKKNESAEATSDGAQESLGSSDEGTADNLQTVYFDFDSSVLTESTKSTLQKNASYLKEKSAVTVQIEGHCDERGSVEYNLALGERRARSVQKYLEALGVSSDRLSIISFGKERPIDDGHDESAWSKNRRSAFNITSK